jgi:hypothetical protein
MAGSEYYVDPQRAPNLGFTELKPQPDVAEPITEKPSWLTGFKTDLAQRSWLVNDPIAIGNKLETLSELTRAGLDYRFDPLQDQYLNLVEPQHQHLLATAATEGEVYRRVAMIQRENANKEILANAPTSSIIAGGFADVLTTPWFWLPIAGGLTSAKFGTEILQSAGRAALSFGVSETISEFNLQQAQQTRSMQESVSNVAMSTLLGGLFGGAGGLYRSVELPFYKQMVSETLGGKLVKLKLNKNFEVEGLNAYSDSAGAMKAQFIDMPGSRLLGWGKDGKLRPARPLIWALGKFGRNPVILGLSSKSPTVVWFTSKTYEHNMDVVKNAVMGKNIEQALQTKLRSWEAQGILASVKMNRFYSEYLGLDPTKAMANVAKRTFKKFPGMLNFADFQREIMVAMVAGEDELLKNPVMKKAAKELYAEFYEPVTKELIDLKILAPDVKPEMAVQYINRVYDTSYMIDNPVKTKEFLRSAYTETNNKIATVTQERNVLADQVEELTTLINNAVDVDAAKPLIEQRKLYKAQIKDINANLQEQVLKGEFDPDMLTGDFGMSHAEIQELRGLKKPIDDFDAAIKAANKDLKKLPKGDPKRKEIRERIKNTKQEKLDYIADVEKRATEGGVDEKLTYMDKATGVRKLKDIDYGTIRLRPLLDETDIGMAAETTYKTLTGQTEEQLLQTIIDSSQLGSGGNNPLMPRSLMISDKSLYQNKLLSSDFASTVRTFNLRMGRLIEMRKMLESRGYNAATDGTPLQWLAYKIDQEYTTFSRQLASKQAAELEGKTGAELDKLTKQHQVENAKLNKDLERDLKIVDITYKRITGTMPRSRKELLQMARIANNYSYATQLGALALLITQDLVSPIFNHGAVKWVKGGVVPFMDMVAFASKENKAKVQEWMSDILVGLETESALYGLAHDTRDKVEFASGWLDRNMAAAATTMGILNFSNAFGSLATKIAAHTSMSSNLRRLAKLLDGTIGKSDAIALGNLGLRDEKLATIIMDQFSRYGEKIRGAYVPGWEKWGVDEVEPLLQKQVANARETFMNAISKDIKSTIFSGSNIASYPLEFDPSGLSKAFMTYMGWMFNATANYTVPLLQRYDQNRINGLVAMWAAASTVEPLRALTRGKEPDLDPSTVFKKGLLNSGALGLPLSLFNTANSMGRVAEGLQVDRYQHRDRGLSLSAGAPGLLTGAALNFLGMAVNNDWNKKEIEGLTRVVPLIHAAEFRAILNKAIDSLPFEDKPQRGKD